MAEKMKVIDGFLSQCEYYGGPKFRENFLAENKRYAEAWKDGDKEKVEEELKEELRYHSSIAEVGRSVIETIRQMNFKEALQATLKITQAANGINIEREVLRPEDWARNLLSVVTPETLEEFLASPLEKLVSPEEMLRRMDRQNAPAVKATLLEKYSDKVNLQNFAVFGDDSIFRDFEDRAEREKDAVGKILATKSSKKALYRTRTRTSYGMFGGGSYESEEADPFDIEEVEKLFLEAVAAGIVPSNYQKIIDNLAKACDYIDSYFSDSFRGSVREGVAKVATEIEKALGETPEGITGKGLEFLPAPGGAERVYLDGKLILTVANASFSGQTTNGEVVAYVVSEQIDQCAIKGSQNRDTVYAWKEGWGKPKELFEDHAYPSERYFRILPPKVDADGKITFHWINGKREEDKEFSV